MLAALNIRNFAIIDELQVSFDGGLNVISGETGAGKSIIIGAVSLLLGDRANSDMIRSHEDSAVVEALFDISGQHALRKKVEDMGFGDVDELVIRRIISRSGKNRVYINNNLASLAALASIGESLINICGQHGHQMIMDPANHMDILDEFGGLLSLCAAYREKYDRYRMIREKLRDLMERQKKREEREDLLRYQIEEITRANIQPGEDNALNEEKKILANIQKLMDLANSAYEDLYAGNDAILAAFRGVVRAVKEIRKIDAGISIAESEMDELYYRIEDAAFILRDYAGRLSSDPARMEAVEERLELLGRLKRKYGGTLDEVIRRCADAEREMKEISFLEDEAEQMARAAESGKSELLKTARLLSAKRRETAAELKQSVEREIRNQRMENTKFEVFFRDPQIVQGETEVNEKGMDALEFYLSTNVGEEMKPLRAIASGGELSRIMLALKQVLARTGSVGTIVFDEVDSGIGGATAEIVGRKLREVAKHHQVLCITHLPQIACCGDNHYRVVKEIAGERTNTAVALLSEEERLEEISRMLGGVAMTEKTKEHAREMLLGTRKAKREAL